jgi:hypothetical protein
MKQSGDLEIKETEKKSIENCVVETQKNNFNDNTIEELEDRIYNLEMKLEKQLLINESLLKNIVQSDKNLKTVNEDFSILAAAVGQIFQIFSQMKIIKIGQGDIDTDSLDDLLEPEPIVEETQNTQPQVNEEEEFDINNLENITDWGSFKEKHKKKFQ